MIFWESLPVQSALVIWATYAVSIWSLCWVFAYVTCGVCKSRARLDGKTVIITGCTAGIGKETALDLARRGGRIIMACRNIEKAKAVREEIVAATGNSSVVVRQLDVSVLSSVRQFAEEILRSEDRLDVLIQNAGVSVRNKTTEDGINEVWATNYFGPFLLTHLLIDLLKKTGKSRVIFLSSILHHGGRITLEYPHPQLIKGSNMTYCNTKLACILLVKELARRLDESEVTANAIHPGCIYTTICEDAPFWYRILGYIIKPMLKSIEQGAQTTIFAAVSDELEGVSGKYFCDCKAFPPSLRTRSVELAKKLWTLSEELVHLKPTDPRIIDRE